MRPSYASLCSVSNFFFSGNVKHIPAVLQPSSTFQWFRLLTVRCQRFTYQPIVFCVVRPTHISLGLAMLACEQQTHFRSSLLSLFSDDRKCVCCSQARLCRQSLFFLQFSGCRPRFSRLAASPLNARTRVHSPLSPPQRLPLGIPIKISIIKEAPAGYPHQNINNQINRKRAGDDGRREHSP